MTGALIIGSGSPLGSAVAKAFTTAGHTVHGASRSGRGGAEAVDITDRDAAAALLRRTRPEVVVTLARPDLPPTTAGADHEIDAAVDSLKRFAMQCNEQGVSRLLFASSAAVYGTDGLSPRAEDAPTPAPSHYARLKLRSERALADVTDAVGLTTIALRIFNVYGPGFSRSLVNRLTSAATGGPPPTVYATDLFVRDYVHADDVAAAFAAAASSPHLEPGTLNVGTGVGTDTLELLALLPDAPWIPGDEFEAASVSVADVTRIRDALDYVPPARLPEVLRSDSARSAT